MSKRKVWSKTVGGYGYSVTVFARSNRGGQLYLRWNRGREWQALGHSDQVRGEAEAKAKAAELLAGASAKQSGVSTVAEFFARYRRDVSKHKKGEQPKEDGRRIDLWLAVLGADRAPLSIDTQTLDDFVRDRAAGRISLEGHELAKKVGRRTIDADLVFLQSVLNWAARIRQSNGLPWLASNPVLGYQRLHEQAPRRPVATYDRFLAVRKAADKIDPQHLFGFFLELVEDLGWRVSAVRQLRAIDYDRATTTSAPNGRIRKAGEFDKEGVEMWVPLSKQARRTLEGLLRVRPAVGDAWLFPSPRDAGKPWSRFHARDLLERAEARAKVPAIAGGDFHPYRRKWATERKHLPLADVAAAGGWQDTRALEQCYQQTDPETMLKVVTESRKLREAK